MRKVWIEEVRDQCMSAGVPFFFKQWGGFNKKKAGRLLDGREWNQYPIQPTKTVATSY
jgi:protein gp37